MRKGRPTPPQPDEQPVRTSGMSRRERRKMWADSRPRIPWQAFREGPG